MDQMPYTKARKLVLHQVACLNGYDPASLQLCVTRPGFIEGIAAPKASPDISQT